MIYGLISTLKGKTVLDLLDFVDRIDRQDVDAAIDIFVIMFTDILLLKNSIGAIANVDLKDDLERISASFDGKHLAAATSIIGQAKKGSHLNVNMNLSLKNAFIKAHPLLVS